MSAIECVHVSRSQIGSLCGFRQMQSRLVSQFGECRFNVGQVSRPNQQVEVGELPNAQIAIQALCEYWSFIWQHFQTASGQSLMDMKEFPCQPQSSMRVDFILPPDRFQEA